MLGGGPAGLAAALEASRIGAEVVLIEEYHDLGGQFYKHVPEEFSFEDRGQAGDECIERAEILDQLRGTHVELMPDTLVWGIFDERNVALFRNDRADYLRAKRLILAPGAQEVPIAFPGWTLPGVMMGGAGQSLLVRQRIRPAHRVVLAGVGPLQLKVASQLVEAGVDVADILEASARFPASIQNALRSMGHWAKLREGLGYWIRLKRARVPYHRRQVPVRALGDEELQAVVVARVDETWKVVPGTERTLEADALYLSYGFLPSIHLARLVGCKVLFAERSGGWITWHDEKQETSVEGVYVAGEAGGIGGAEVAAEEGRIAALAAACSLGRTADEGCRRREQQARRRLASAKRFAALIGDMMLLKPALFDLMTDETVVCRCESVTVREVKEALVDGDATVRGVKIRTRAGMGRCQGRMCSALIRQLIRRETGTPLGEILLDTPRAPIKPIPLHALARPEAGSVTLFK